jgi:hypothetical protein
MSQQIRYEVRGAPRKLFRLAQEEVQAALAGGEARQVHEWMLHGGGGTGKSRGILMWLWWLMDNYRSLWPECPPDKNLRILACRQTRVSLTQAALATWEDAVVPRNHPILEGAGRAQRMSYIHPSTGAELVLAGMDEPTRLFSTDYDIIYVQEATEVTEAAWESLRRGLRNWALPFQMLVGDCNPDAPRHWLRRRMLDGRTTGVKSEHWDNPRWWAQKNGVWGWTPEGTAYRDSLSKLSGVRRRRLYLGEWVSAEGAVWEDFEEEVHIVEKAPELRWTVASLDWGFTAPGVLQVWGVDGDSRAFCVREHYRTQKVLDWWAGVIAEEYRQHRFQFCVADPSRPDSIRIVNDMLAAKGLPRLLREADNRRAEQGADLGGIDLVRQKLKVLGDGKPSLSWVKGYLHSRDESLHDKGEPCCTTEEIPSYVYAKVEDGSRNKERTDPNAADHGCFVAHTWIRTKEGGKFISEVEVGDEVWTSDGVQTVLAAGMTQESAELWELTTVCGVVLVGTADHPIWANGEWTQLADLKPWDTLVRWPAEASTHQKNSSRFESSLEQEWPKLRLATQLLLPHLSDDEQSWVSGLHESTSAAFAFGRWSETPSLSHSQLAASDADSGTTVWRRLRRKLPSTPNMESGSVLSVATPCSQTQAAPPRFALDTVERVRRIAVRAPVYGLSVQSSANFFANGVLVHNCDAMRYMARSIWGKDLGGTKAATGYSGDSFGHILGHAEVWKQIRSGKLNGRGGF